MAAPPPLTPRILFGGLVAGVVVVVYVGVMAAGLALGGWWGADWASDRVADSVWRLATTIAGAAGGALAGGVVALVVAMTIGQIVQLFGPWDEFFEWRRARHPEPAPPTLSRADMREGKVPAPTLGGSRLGGDVFNPSELHGRWVAVRFLWHWQSSLTQQLEDAEQAERRYGHALTLVSIIRMAKRTPVIDQISGRQFRHIVLLTAPNTLPEWSQYTTRLGCALIDPGGLLVAVSRSMASLLDDFETLTPALSSVPPDIEVADAGVE